MLTLLTKMRHHSIYTQDGLKFEVKHLMAHTEEGLQELRDLEPVIQFDDIELVLLNKFFNIKVSLPLNLRQAMVYFINHYHAKEILHFDCYAFACLVAKHPEHREKWINRYWKLRPKPWFLKRGDVVFLMDGEWKHAAIYLGYGLYISVYGGGGDLEISTLKQMKRGFKPGKVYLAEPSQSES